MTYRLNFLPSAEKDWKKLGAILREQFAKKLSERLNHPRVPKDALHALPNHYKIKLRDAGYRLIYRVEDQILVVLVVSIGKREHAKAYRKIPRD